ncbi:MAG TPA: tRNA (adenosine(37)-N6)-threonylcarbamoyltransferase complex dimerization subunit type 1 TsaB, partial [Anaeromyxobacteraceae bacterium]
MLIAALDTSTLTLSCALCELAAGEVRLVAERTEHAPARPGPQGPTGGHGGRLPGVLQELLLAAGRRLPEVEGYAVGLGPGSFTGLRIGLATWKGLAYANQRPIAGASSLAALALAAAGAAGPGALLVPLLDAKKGEVYAGFYRALGEGVEAAAPEAALPPHALAARAEALAAEGARPAVFGP